MATVAVKLRTLREKLIEKVRGMVRNLKGNDKVPSVFCYQVIELNPAGERTVSFVLENKDWSQFFEGIDGPVLDYDDMPFLLELVDSVNVAVMERERCPDRGCPDPGFPGCALLGFDGNRLEHPPPDCFKDMLNFISIKIEKMGSTHIDMNKLAGFMNMLLSILLHYIYSPTHQPRDEELRDDRFRRNRESTVEILCSVVLYMESRGLVNEKTPARFGDHTDLLNNILKITGK
eukprot:TRINITY_DN30500_c0_g1_i1.p1 TRINITY_DN30500_c0_g1~~TRINITY_DN30500_c0_g1_i1.p1  ORF type:complete len:233 (-),score=16.10 TRINITY_DN30500_c0_g1_i1:17-715(-)